MSPRELAREALARHVACEWSDRDAATFVADYVPELAQALLAALDDGASATHDSIEGALSEALGGVPVGTDEGEAPDLETLLRMVRDLRKRDRAALGLTDDTDPRPQALLLSIPPAMLAELERHGFVPGSGSLKRWLLGRLDAGAAAERACHAIAEEIGALCLSNPNPETAERHRLASLALEAWATAEEQADPPDALTMVQGVLGDKIESPWVMRQKVARLERERGELRAALDELQSRPWGPVDTLLRLADGADHLFTVHGCDQHGYETLMAARDSARELAPLLARLLQPANKATP